MRILMSFLTLFTLVTIAVTASAQAEAYSEDYIGEQVLHRAAFEDTLIHLARNNGLGFIELRAANPGLDAWIPGAGAKIILPTRHLLPDAPRKGIVINLAEMRLYHFKNVGEPPKTYPISIGREGLQTPKGTTKITRKKDGPTWRPTKRMREEDPELPISVPPGPENPLGSHALYLGWPQYLIHGTNKPYGIGRRVSSGCMRMYPEDIVKLFPKVPVGTPVTVVDQPIKVGWIGGGFYVEISPNQAQTLQLEEEKEVEAYQITEDDVAFINKKAGVHKDDLNWDKIRKAVKNYNGYPIKVFDTDDLSVFSEAKTEVKTKTANVKNSTVDQKPEVVKEEAVDVDVKSKKNTFSSNKKRASVFNE